MTNTILLSAIARFLHNLFTAVWVGGLLMLTLTIVPAAKQMFGSNPQAKNMVNAISKRHSVWVYVSIAGLILTGILQARLAPGFQGLMQFSNLYSAVLSIKHILAAAMVAIALYRSLVLVPRQAAATPAQNRLSLALLFTNTALGVVVLFLSGLSAAL